MSRDFIEFDDMLDEELGAYDAKADAIADAVMLGTAAALQVIPVWGTIAGAALAAIVGIKKLIVSSIQNKKKKGFRNAIRDKMMDWVKDKPESLKEEFKTFFHGPTKYVVYDRVSDALWPNPQWKREDVVKELIQLVQEGFHVKDALLSIASGGSPQDRQKARDINNGHTPPEAIGSVPDEAIIAAAKNADENPDAARQAAMDYFGPASTLVITASANPEATLANQNVIKAAMGNNAEGVGIPAMMQAMTPQVANVVQRGGDAAVAAIIRSMPDQVKVAVREAVASIRAGEAEAQNAHLAVASRVDEALHPKLALALTALEQRRLQTQATQEHKSIVRRRAFERGFTSKLDRIEDLLENQ